MRLVAVAVALCSLVAPVDARQVALAAGADLDRRVLTVVRAALEPALPFPATDASGAMPVGEVVAPLWMVKPLDPEDGNFEVLANPLNADNQARSNQAMAQIEVVVEAAQKKSQAQYERALAAVQHTGRSQDVDGVTLADEGVPGERIDAESHVIVDVLVNQTRYAFQVASSVEPVVVPGVPVPFLVYSVPDNVYRERADSEERYCQARTFVLFGRFGQIEIKRSGVNYDVTWPAGEGPGGGPGVRTIVVRLAGNNDLIADIVKNADWSQVRALVEP